MLERITPLAVRSYFQETKVPLELKTWSQLHLIISYCRSSFNLIRTVSLNLSSCPVYQFRWSVCVQQVYFGSRLCPMLSVYDLLLVSRLILYPPMERSRIQSASYITVAEHFSFHRAFSCRLFSIQKLVLGVMAWVNVQLSCRSSYRHASA